MDSDLTPGGGNKVGPGTSCSCYIYQTPRLNDPQLQALKEERKAERKKQKGKKPTKEEKKEKAASYNSATRGVGSH